MPTYIGNVNIPGTGQAAQINTENGDTLGAIAAAWTNDPALSVALSGFNGLNVSPGQALSSGLTINIPFQYLNPGAALSVGATPLPVPSGSAAPGGILAMLPASWPLYAAGLVVVLLLLSRSRRS